MGARLRSCLGSFRARRAAARAVAFRDSDASSAATPARRTRFRRPGKRRRRARSTVMPPEAADLAGLTTPRGTTRPARPRSCKTHPRRRVRGSRAPASATRAGRFRPTFPTTTRPRTSRPLPRPSRPTRRPSALRRGDTGLTVDVPTVAVPSTIAGAHGPPSGVKRARRPRTRRRRGRVPDRTHPRCASRTNARRRAPTFDDRLAVGGAPRGVRGRQRDRSRTAARPRPRRSPVAAQHAPTCAGAPAGGCTVPPSVAADASPHVALLRKH